MIGYIDGVVRTKRDTALVVGSAGGPGYIVNVTASVWSSVNVGEYVELFVETRVSDTDIVLYGLATDDDRKMFNALNKVNKVGGKTALAALDTLGYDGVVAAVQADDAKAMAKVPGVGLATAQRIVVDMKKFVTSLGIAQVSAEERSLITLTMTSLEFMGYKRTEVSSLVSEIYEATKDRSPTVADLVAAVLRAKASTPNLFMPA
jgi:Holliday junction DNA helicase RuvA